MTATVLGPAQLLVVLANIDPSRKGGWQAKHRVVAVVGAGSGAVSVDTIARASGLSTSTVHRVLGELAESRVLVRVEAGRGRRSTAWAIQADLDRWERVPWLTDPRAVAFEVFHVAPPRDTSPGLRRDPMNRDTSVRSVAIPYIATQPGLASRSHESRRNPAACVAIPYVATQPEGPGEKGFPTPESELSASVLAGGTEAGLDRSSGEWRGLRALVVRAGGGRFLAGRAEADLAALAALYGVEQVRAWVTEAPPRLGVPALVAWLTDRPHMPTDEELAALAARDQDDDEPAAEPARPYLREYEAPTTDERADPAAAAAAMAAARAALKPTDQPGRAGRIHTDQEVPA